MENYYFLTLAFILLFNITTLTSSTALLNPTKDQLALLFFKNTITSDPHGLLTKNWSTATSVCNWIGVTCSVNPQRVTMLNVSHFALGGTISPYIGNLTFLRSLDVSFNNFTGSMPSELSNLRRLEEFYAGVNSLGGEIPEEVGKLTSLISIDLRHNSLKGSIPFSIFNISTLRILDISFNQFDGTLPPNIGISLFNVERLYMNGNTLSGPIPSSITNASKLTHLEMDHNSFSGSIPDFGDLRLLRVLRLRGNNFTAAESTSQELGFFSSLTSCRYLEVLDVSDNPLHGVLPAASIGNLSTSLLQLRAGGCIINGVIPPEIGNLSSLQGLYLYENQLQGHIPHHLCQMTNLAELDLSANTLMGSIPECFGEIKSLRHMNLAFNKLKSTVPSNFWDLSKLLILNLSSNYLSGNLSTQIGNLKAIYKMDLSSNQFSGDIPSSLDSCQSLETLSFSNNMLTGSIPQCLGSIRGLSRFDLSYNNLSGLIPRSLEKIPFLEHFNVSYNSLDGEIPNEGPFVNFSAQSFVHNSALCGSSRFQVPPCIKNNARLKVGALVVAYIVASSFSVMIWVIILFVLTRVPLHSGDHDRIPDRIPDRELGATWRIISHSELVQATNGFSKTNLLGRGGCASVFKGTLSDGSDVAVKVFNLESEGAVNSFDTECEILSSVRHRNIVGIIGCCTNEHFKALILTYMPNGSLEDWLYCQDVVQRLNIATDVALALEYLHHHHTFPVVHCDIKPSNVLFDKDMTAHLADFGIGKLLDEGEAVVQTATLQATIGYAAPEYGSHGKVSTNGDVYGYGIMLLEMFTGKKPTGDKFYADFGLKEWVSEAVERNAISEVMDPTLLSKEDPHFLPKEFMSVFLLAMKCLANSPSDRVNMIEVVFILQKIKYDMDSEMTRKSSPYYAIAEMSPPN